MSKKLIDRYEELVPGTKDRLSKTDEERAEVIERFFKTKAIKCKGNLEIMYGMQVMEDKFKE